ncbi:MAG: TolC family protein [Deltaproteobacteria bacterium]|nr:TolC family protein [Deltaproteobacteria bacterium]
MSVTALMLVMAMGGPALTLEQAVRSAEAHQPQLRQAHFTSEAAEARADQGMAPLLPQVTGSASYRRSTSNFAPQPGQSSVTTRTAANSFNTVNSYNFGITATQLIYDFGQTTGRWRASQASAEAQRANEDALRLQIVLAARSAFFAARAQKELVRVAEQTVANQKKHLEQIQGFVEVKTRPEIDLAQAKLDMANADLQLINAQLGYARSKAQLNQAMGVVRDTDYDVADESLPALQGEEAPIDVLTQEAARRPDLIALQKQIRAQQLTLRAIKGAYGPSLSVSTGLTDSGVQLDNMAWNWNGSINLSWQIFQGNITRSQVREAEANLAGLAAQYDNSVQQIRLVVEQARISIHSAKAAQTIAEAALQNATQRLALAEGRYQAGVGSIIELGDAQLAFTAAASQKVQAEYTLASARAQLLQALGRR